MRAVLWVRNRRAAKAEVIIEDYTETSIKKVLQTAMVDDAEMVDVPAIVDDPQVVRLCPGTGKPGGLFGRDVY